MLALVSCGGLVPACAPGEGETAGDGDGDSAGDGDLSTGGMGSGGDVQQNGIGGTASSGGSFGVGGGFPSGGMLNASGGDTGAGGSAPGSGGSQSYAARSMGYVGCSMSDNVASGYAAAGGDRMWPSLPAYWGQVVQDWANPDDPVWDTFDDQVEMYGVPEAVWIMVCIFNPPGVEIQEMRDIVGLVRQRAPEATIYTTGQPFYDENAPCSAAGDEGPQWTDDIAQEMADDPSLSDVNYVGKFGPLAANQKEDPCHANADGRLEMGQQAIEFFGD